MFGFTAAQFNIIFATSGAVIPLVDGVPVSGYVSRPTVAYYSYLNLGNLDIQFALTASGYDPG